MAGPLETIERAEFKKKKKKLRGDSEGDDFNPFATDDVKQSVEVTVKQVDKKSLEKVEKKGRKKMKKTSNIKKTKAKQLSSSKASKGRKTTKKATKKGKGEYELIITEKPQAAFKIANALADNSVSKETIQNVPYYVLQRKGKTIVVACAVGHLYTLAQIKKQSGWPIYDIEWKPNFEVRKQDFSKKYYNVILKLAKKAQEVVVATDYDIEGEVIGLNVVRYLCERQDAERMKFSTLTTSEINNAYDNKAHTLNWNQAISGETRHFLDWIYGINLSRALMEAIKSAGSFRIMSIGRIQGPALKLIVEKEKQIQKFKPEPYWQVFLDVKGKKDGVKIEVKYPKDITKKEKNKLKDFEKLKGKSGEAETKKSQSTIPPLVPFDLTTLQTEAYKFYKITPTNTLQTAQKLYLGGLISYPRTSSQKIPETINYKKILKRLSEKFEFTKHAVKEKPVEGKKSDPAHPSIYPTGEFSNLEDQDKKIYELIVKRFVACFAQSAVLDNKRISVKVNGYNFFARGTGVREKGWLNIYPAKFQEKEIPDLNGPVLIEKVKIQEKETKPPKRFSPASIISELEKKNLGTKSTRAAIVETLYNRGYIREQSIEATPIGIAIINSLEKNCPIIIDEKLTRQFEKDMGEIEKTKKIKQKQKKVLQETKKTMENISKKFRKKEVQIGKDLIKANKAHTEQLRKENELKKCPVCNKGTLRILYNRKLRRYFVACDAYPDCKTTYTLPANGLVKKTDKICEHCGYPILLLIKKAKRPWEFCFNPQCKSRQEYEKRRAEYSKNKEQKDVEKQDKV